MEPSSVHFPFGAFVMQHDGLQQSSLANDFNGNVPGSALQGPLGKHDFN
jgi:hypothetical protein